MAIYNNKTQSKFAYEVEITRATEADESSNLGEFKTAGEARKAVKDKKIKAGSLVTIWKHSYSPQTSAYSSAISSSHVHAEFLA